MRQEFIPEFPEYSVFDMGQIYSHRDGGCYLESQLKVDGYLWVTFMKDGEFYHRPIHFLVAQAFVPNPEKLSNVYHNDGYKLNNRYSNLRWCK